MYKRQRHGRLIRAQGELSALCSGLARVERQRRFVQRDTVKDTHSSTTDEALRAAMCASLTDAVNALQEHQQSSAAHAAQRDALHSLNDEITALQATLLTVERRVSKRKKTLPSFNALFVKHHNTLRDCLATLEQCDAGRQELDADVVPLLQSITKLSRRAAPHVASASRYCVFSSVVFK